MSHSIDHQTLRKAADQLTSLADAGYAEQVRREYHERLADAGLRRSTWRNPLREYQLQSRAELLALVTSAPLHQCRAALLEATGAMPERDIGLALLADLTGDLRRVEAQRRTFARRQTA